MLPPKNRPRYLPTLTQVVTQADLEVVDPVVRATGDELSKDTDDLRVQEITRSLMPTISARLREISQAMLDERLHHLEANMQAEVESMVRRAMNGCELTPNVRPQ